MKHLMDVTMCWGPHSGGIRRYVLAKRDWLASCTQDWHHTLLSPRATGPGVVPVPGVPLPGSGGYRLPLAMERNARLIERQSPDLIEIGDVFTLASSALRASQRMGIPLVGFCHSNLVSLGARWGGAALATLARRHARKVYNQCDLVMAPSQDMVNHLQDWGVHHVRLQRLGVDTDVFHPNRRDDACWRRLGLPPNARVLLYAGRFAPEKNIDLLVRAVLRLGPPHVLVCVGDGPAPPQRQRSVIRLPFTSDLRKLATFMASADVFVHAGREETFGLAVLEAMACGCPVVAPCSGGLQELVDEQVGHGVESAGINSFVDAIEWTLDQDRVRLSRQARARALVHGWHRVLPGLVNQYGRLLA